MSKIIPPRRGEAIIAGERPTDRTSEFLEALSSGVNTLSSEATEVAASQTTTGNATLICTGAAAKTITLNPSPYDREFVTVIRQGAGTLALSGGINGGSSYTVATQYDTVTVMYTIAAGEWSIIGAFIQ